MSFFDCFGRVTVTATATTISTTGLQDSDRWTKPTLEQLRYSRLLLPVLWTD